MFLLSERAAMFDPAGDGKSCHGSLPISVKLEPAVSLHLSKKAYPSFAGMAAVHPIPPYGSSLYKQTDVSLCNKRLIAKEYVAR